MIDEQIIAYEEKVSEAMHALYGLSWKDAGGDANLMRQGLEEHINPTEFARLYGEKYALNKIERSWV